MKYVVLALSISFPAVAMEAPSMAQYLALLVTTAAILEAQQQQNLPPEPDTKKNCLSHSDVKPPKNTQNHKNSQQNKIIQRPNKR